MEQLDLNTPETKPSITNYRVVSLFLDWEGLRIQVTVKGSDGFGRVFEYSNTAALTLMTGLNTANLSTKSLHRRIMERLQADGLLGAGTYSGIPG